MDWRNRGTGQPDLPADAPTLLIIHGLNGNSEEACVLYSMVSAPAPLTPGVFIPYRHYVVHYGVYIEEVDVDEDFASRNCFSSREKHRSIE